MIPLGNRTGIYYVDFFLPGEKAKDFLKEINKILHHHFPF